MQTLYIAALIISAGLATVGILSRHFGDNTLQRIGLSVIGMASCSEIWLAFTDANCCQASNGKDLFIMGFAVYALGTMMKVHRYKGM